MRGTITQHHVRLPRPSLLSGHCQCFCFPFYYCKCRYVSCSCSMQACDGLHFFRKFYRWPFVLHVFPRRCGYDARCEKFRLTCQHVNADLCFPVRLEALAKKWHRHVLYEPEVHARACFYLQHPRCCVSITSSGKANVFDAPNLEDGQEAIRRVYSIFREFSC